MTDFKVDIAGLQGLNRKMVKFAKQFPKITREIMYKWAQQTRRRLKQPYPPKNNKKMVWVSAKQRAYVMGAIARGEIVVPYRRTGALANRWSAARVENGVVIRNSASYARYVVGDRTGQGQYYMHEGRWFIARKFVDAELPHLKQMLIAGIKAEWNK